MKTEDLTHEGLKKNEQLHRKCDKTHERKNFNFLRIIKMTAVRNLVLCLRNFSKWKL